MMGLLTCVLISPSALIHTFHAASFNVAEKQFGLMKRLSRSSPPLTYAGILAAAALFSDRLHHNLDCKDLTAVFVVLLRLIKAVDHIQVGFAVLIPFFLIFGFAGVIKALQRVGRGAGAVYALLGRRYEEYAQR
jgi:hypothetical protein